MQTTWEKLQGATLSLARSGPIKDRLSDAYRNYLCSIREDELPREVRDEFRAVSSTLTRERPMLRGEDAARATIRKMSIDEADRTASAIVRVFSGVPKGSQTARHPSVQVVAFHAAEA
ncbi:MAG: hypothetical protein ACREU3_05220 [Steroidobacteraceae bacterium]